MEFHVWIVVNINTISANTKIFRVADQMPTRVQEGDEQHNIRDTQFF